MKKLLPPILFVLALLLMVVLDHILPIKKLIFPPFHYTGIVMFVCGFVIVIVGKGHFSKLGATIMTFYKPNMLVTDGLFRYSRNPMYLGFTLATAGVAVLLGSLSSLLVAIGFYIITDRWYIPYEENQMQMAFGESYATYCKTVRRWI